MADEGKVLMFPGTIRYYQEQITELLENERYPETTELLSGLLDSSIGDEEDREEWQSILDWLVMMYPELHLEQNEEEVSEADLLRKRVEDRVVKDHTYGEKLLSKVLNETSMQEKFSALDQLIHIPNDEVNEKLIRWLEQTRSHPYIQFKAMQTLRTRGSRETVRIVRLGELVTVEIDAIPLNLEDYPEKISAILDRVQQVVESENPLLADFAREMWKEILMIIYGTSLYREMISDETDESRSADANIDGWACALTIWLMEKVSGSADREQLYAAYGITSEIEEQAARYLQALQFAASKYMPGFVPQDEL